MMTNPNDAAFPVKWLRDETGAMIRNYHGLTKRELFAAMAMQGYCASEITRKEPAQGIAILAEAMADALIAELNKEVTK